jgi:hypothetical protein
MENVADKRREDRLRRVAARMGLALRKSRARDPMRMDFGRYRIINVETDYVVAGRFPYGYTLDLDAVEDVLEELELCREEEAFRRDGPPALDPPVLGRAGEFDAKWGS